MNYDKQNEAITEAEVICKMSHEKMARFSKKELEKILKSFTECMEFFSTNLKKVIRTFHTAIKKIEKELTHCINYYIKGLKTTGQIGNISFKYCGGKTIINFI